MNYKELMDIRGCHHGWWERAATPTATSLVVSHLWTSKGGAVRRECTRYFCCPVPPTVRGTQALVSFVALAPSVFCAAR